MVEELRDHNAVEDYLFIPSVVEIEEKLAKAQTR